MTHESSGAQIDRVARNIAVSLSRACHCVTCALRSATLTCDPILPAAPALTLTLSPRDGQHVISTVAVAIYIRVLLVYCGVTLQVRNVLGSASAPSGPSSGPGSS